MIYDIKLNRNRALMVLRKKGASFSCTENGETVYKDIMEDNDKDVSYWENRYKDFRVYYRGSYWKIGD